ncbi:hypothetical protein E2562_035505 [Oryza meyeriana var. granulata]|uniref:Uncharacterized protein n=1 Tax=Oryza meyeriana var. granulata TaxID=110450 RepID=A0A6G1DC97_9ORYZ|nr:hypothetical protein E2562_035505 [Oryza meyeriana var. granulata]
MASYSRKVLPMLAVEGVDEYAASERSERFQLYIDPLITLSNAVAMNARVRPGDRTMAFELYNPEMLRRKVEAEAAVRDALARMEMTEEKTRTKIQRTERKILEVQAKLELGADAVRVGPSINHRSLPFEQVIYQSGVDLPEGEVAAPNRKLSKNVRRLSRTLDAKSQMAFWNQNLLVLQQKKAAQESFLAALTESKEALSFQCLETKTNIGCGYTGNFG